MKRFLELLLGFDSGELAGGEWSVRLLAAPTNAWAVVGLVVGAGLLVWLIVRSYLREGEVRRRAQMALAALRIAVVMAVVATLLEPALSLRRTHTDHAAVAVLLDDSLSMSLPDAYEPARRAALAAATGADEAELAAMSRAEIVRRLLDRQGGPLARLAEDHPLMVVGFSTDRPETEGYTRPLASIEVLDDAPAGPAAKPPGETGIVVAACAAGAAGLWVLALLGRAVLAAIRRKEVPAPSARPPRLWAPLSGAVAAMAMFVAGTYAVNAYRARAEALRAATAEPQPAPQDARPALAEQVREALAGVTGRGYQTDLARAIRETADRLKGRRVAGLVVVSDGQSTAGAAGAARLNSLREFCHGRNIPLLTVGVGSESPAANIRVASLAIPRQIRRGSQTPVRVTVQSRNYHGQPVRVELLARPVGQDDWRPTGLEQTAPLAAAEDEAGLATTVIDLPPLVADELGEFVYKAVVARREGELLGDDNEATARVTVTDQKLRVLLISGDAGWEYQYLRNFLLRDPQRFLVSCWQQNAESDFNQESSTAGMQLTRLPRTMAELVDGYDAVILYDPSYRTDGYDEQFVRLLEQFVDRHRGGLCYIASNKYTTDYLYAPDRSAAGPFEPLVNMLPVVLSGRMTQVAERIGRENRVGWPLRLTGVGAESPLMQLADGGQASRTAWERMPGLFWAQPVARLKPAAVALAVSSDPADRTDEGDPLPMIASQFYGGGPVVYVGFDDSWRWRYVADGAYYRRFWGNMVEHLGSYRMLRKRVLIAAAGESFAVGERIAVSAEVYDEQIEPAEQAEFVIRAVHVETGAAVPVVLAGDGRDGHAGRAGLFRGSVVLRRPGQYVLTAAAGFADDQVAEKYLAVTTPQEEFARPEADLASLRTLSGDNRFYACEDIDALAADIPAARLEVVEETTRELWNLWLSAAAMVLLLIVEWIGRKKHNMA